MKKNSKTEKRAIVVIYKSKMYVYTSTTKALEALTGKKPKVSIVNKLNKKMGETPDKLIKFMEVQLIRIPLNKMFFVTHTSASKS